MGAVFSCPMELTVLQEAPMCLMPAIIKPLRWDGKEQGFLASAQMTFGAVSISVLNASNMHYRIVSLASAHKVPEHVGC